MEVKGYLDKQTYLDNNIIEELKLNLKLTKRATIRAKIVDINKNEITISINGNLINGNIKQPIPANIGSVQTFDVSYDENGKLILLYKMPSNDAIQKNLINDVLMDLGMKLNEENIKNAMLLMQNNFAVNNENLQRINQGIKFFKEDNINKALFFLENNLNISYKNEYILNSLLSGENKILNQTKSFINNINNLSYLMQNTIYSILSTNDDILNQNKLVGNLLLNISKQPENIQDKIKSQLIREDLTFNKQLEIKQILLQSFPQYKEIVENGFKDSLNIVDLINQNNVKLKSEIINEYNNNSFTYENLQNIFNNITNINIYRPNYLNNILKHIFHDDKQTFLILYDKLNNVSQFSKLKQIESKFFFNPVNTNSKNFEEFLLSLKLNVNNILSELTSNNADESTNLVKDLVNIKETLEFTLSLKSDTFVQIPVIINNHKFNMELYIFKNKNRSKKNADPVSALICLDTKNIGRVEVFLQKNNKDVSFNFRLENNEVKGMIEQNFKILINRLKLFNYYVSNISFTEFKKPFNILENPLIEVNKNITQKDSKFKFDLRI